MRARAVPLLAAGLIASAAIVSADDPAGNAQLASDLNNIGVAAAQEGRWADAVEHLRRAVKVNPDAELLRKNLSGILTDWAAQLEQAGDAANAEPLLLEAVTYDPDNGFAYVRLGDLAYFRRSDFSGAISCWKRANGKISAAEWRPVADRISQAQRDAAIEREFVSKPTAHFDIRVHEQGKADWEAFGRQLEEAYAHLTERMGTSPPNITAILYSARDLRRTYNQRDWALGFYDGRLRLAGRELGTQMTPMLIAHELTHAFLRYAYGPTLPIWVHEGFAQFQEGDRPRAKEELQQEQAVRDGGGWVPLKWLDRRFTQPTSRDDIVRAYTQARLVVAALVTRHGTDHFKQFMSALASGTPVSDAYEAAFTPERWVATDTSSFLQ